ncbi:M48 family metallopeptidase [Neisseria sp. Ec49-e6-T10]|uniref:M48 family metallopeptidase n=1 Tax=Neisseria sp. Ec49-e6-T10 TaxID=3140744 RepID=UPI003EC07D7D
MSTHTVNLLFIVFLLISTGLRLYLSVRQTLYVGKHRQIVPKDFVQSISLVEHQKAADYTLAKQKLGRYEVLYEAFLLLIFTLGGGLDALAVLSAQLSNHALFQGVILMFLFIIVNAILSLPFDLYRTFKLEERFGFNHTTLKTFIGDLLKAGVLMVVLGIPLLSAVLYLMGAMGKVWWLYVWVLWLGFSLFMLWAFPAFIAPLFNKFEPVEDEALKTTIERLLARTGFTSNGIFVMDGSKRSGHGNAYFTGLGNNKRIVFFDTLLKDLSTSEVEAVLAHELGHFKHKHIVKGMIFSFVLSLIVLFLLGQVMLYPAFFEGLGVHYASDAMALLLFLTVLPVFTFPFSPLGSIFSRKNEYEADRFAKDNASGEALISALTKLYQSNAATLTPDPLFSRFYDSHPNAKDRIYALKEQH